MPNNRRFHLPNIPQHVVQRGNNRLSCFLSDDDHAEYLLRLKAASRKCGVAIHAYVLMSNHVHLLATPESGDGVGKMMQAVGSGYVRSFNCTHGRTGTLWEGRYFSSPVGTDGYLWNCHKYIELNPVRARIVSDAARYRWSSFARNALGRADDVVTPHPAYAALAKLDQHVAYRKFFEETLCDATAREIRERLRKERAFGSEAFLATIEGVAARSPRCRSRGRPWPEKREEQPTLF